MSLKSPEFQHSSIILNTLTNRLQFSIGYGILMIIDQNTVFI